MPTIQSICPVRSQPVMKEPHNRSQGQVLRVWEVAARLVVDGGVFVGVFLCCPFSRGVSWMRYGNLLGQFIRVFLPTFFKT